MLTKLLKYEFKATMRLFLPLYLALIAFALINRYISPFKMLESAAYFLDFRVIASLLSILAYFALIVGVTVMTMLIMIQRFYKNLLGDEGYLMFTLPVHAWQHIVSKLVVAMVWNISSLIVTLGSILILAAKADLRPPLLEALGQFKEIFGVPGFFVWPGAALVFLVSSILMIYAAIALGHLFSKHKLLASFAMYCALHVVSQVIAFIIIVQLATQFSRYFGVASAHYTVLEFNLAVFTLTLPFILLGVGYYLLTNMILKRRLNLE